MDVTLVERGPGEAPDGLTADVTPNVGFTLIFFPMLLISVLLAHIAHRTKYKYATEGSIALMVGLFTGGLAFAWAQLFGMRLPSSLFAFNTDAFFNLLLPPVIFNAGFSVKKKLFFANCVTLALYGVLGTFISWAIVSGGAYYLLILIGVHEQGASAAFHDAVALGTILSSTDSVATLQVLKADAYPMLHSLVFGEGVVNDATSLVLLRALDRMESWQQLSGEGLRMMMFRFSYLFVLSLMLGVGVGLLSALLIRRLFSSAHSTDSEVLLVFGMGLLAYSFAEALDLSGIFSVFFAGVTMSHYTWHSLSPSAKVVTVYLFRILSFGVEVFLFIYCGFDVWSVSQGQKEEVYSKLWVLRTGSILSFSLLLLVMVGRAAFLLPITALANCWRKEKVSWREVLVIWWAGIMRGAISIAMTYHHFHEQPPRHQSPEQRVIVLACIAIVLLTTLVMGAFTKIVLARVMPPAAPYGLPEGPPGPENGSARAGGQAPLSLPSVSSSIPGLWRHLDDRYLKPMFGGKQQQFPPPPPQQQQPPNWRASGGGLLGGLSDPRVQFPPTSYMPPLGGTDDAGGLQAPLLPPGSPPLDVSVDLDEDDTEHISVAAVHPGGGSTPSMFGAAGGGGRTAGGGGGAPFVAPQYVVEVGGDSDALRSVASTMALAGPGVGLDWYSSAQNVAFSSALGGLDSPRPSGQGSNLLQESLRHDLQQRHRRRRRRVQSQSRQVMLDGSDGDDDATEEPGSSGRGDGAGAGGGAFSEHPEVRTSASLFAGPGAPALQQQQQHYQGGGGSGDERSIGGGG